MPFLWTPGSSSGGGGFSPPRLASAPTYGDDLNTFGPSLSNSANVSLDVARETYFPLDNWQDITIAEIVLLVNSVTTANTGMLRVSIYTSTSDGTNPSALLEDWGQVDISTTGTKTITSLSLALTQGRYWIRMNTDVTAVALKMLGAANFSSYNTGGRRTIRGNTLSSPSTSAPSTATPTGHTNVSSNEAVQWRGTVT